MSGRPAKSLKAAADAADGAESGKSTAGFDTHTVILTDDPHCVGPVIDALCDLRRKNPGNSEITTAIGSVRSHRQRMRGREARDAGAPIGSDPTKEAAHTMIVNTRLKRSGQRWGRAGGQGVLTVRARLTSGRFDNVWAQLTHRRRHAQAHLSANDNRTPLATIARLSPKSPDDSPKATNQESSRVQTQPEGNHSQLPLGILMTVNLSV